MTLSIATTAVPGDLKTKLPAIAEAGFDGIELSEQELTGFDGTAKELKRMADDRPAFVLAHRMVERRPDYTAAMDLQYYAQHSYNSMLTLVACVPFGESTLVVSGVRLFTDRVTGFASGTRKNIGRKHVAVATNEYFQDLRQVLEGK